MANFKEIVGPSVIVILIIFISSFFKRKKEWEYEAKLFDENHERPIGELEIEKYKDNSPVGELTLYGNHSVNDGSIAIYLNEELITELQISQNGMKVELGRDFNQQRPSLKPKKQAGKFYFPLDPDIKLKNHDKVTVKTPKHPSLTGVMVWD